MIFFPSFSFSFPFLPVPHPISSFTHPLWTRSQAGMYCVCFYRHFSQGKLQSVRKRVEIRDIAVPPSSFFLLPPPYPKCAQVGQWGSTSVPTLMGMVIATHPYLVQKLSTWDSFIPPPLFFFFPNQLRFLVVHWTWVFLDCRSVGDSRICFFLPCLPLCLLLRSDQLKALMEKEEWDRIWKGQNQDAKGGRTRDCPPKL